MDALLHAILKERQQQGFGYEMALRADITKVLLWFIRKWHDGQEAAELGDEELEKLQAALRFIEDHLDEPIEIADVARSLGQGRSTFSRFFFQGFRPILPGLCAVHSPE